MPQNGSTDFVDVDVKIGRYIRQMRIIRGLKQVELASAIGVSFQQLQKYETGTNRLHIGRLIRICDALKIDMKNFFTGLKSFLSSEQGAVLCSPENNLATCDGIWGDTNYSQDNPQSQNSKEIINLLEAYRNIKNARLKKQINRLVKELSEIYTSESN